MRPVVTSRIQVNPSIYCERWQWLPLIRLPARTIPLSIVDPDRQAPAAVGQRGHQYFVAPDNGVLRFVYDRETGHVDSRNVEHCISKPFISKTFMAAIFSHRVAAWLAKMRADRPAWNEITELQAVRLPKPKAANGHVRRVMRNRFFRNLLTLPRGISAELRADRRKINLSVVTTGDKSGRNVSRWATRLKPVRLWLHGYVEIAVNKGQRRAIPAIGRRQHRSFSPLNYSKHFIRLSIPSTAAICERYAEPPISPASPILHGMPAPRSITANSEHHQMWGVQTVRARPFSIAAPTLGGAKTSIPENSE